MAVVTVSRAYGTGEDTFVSALASHFGYRVADRSMIDEVADELNVDSSLILRQDERGDPPVVARMVGALLGRPWRARHDEPRVGDGPTREVVRSLIRETIRRVADAGDVVIVGRGANFQLYDRRDLVTVRLVAPMDYRVKRVSMTLSMTEEEARREIDRIDTERRRYVEEEFDEDPQDPSHYDLMFDMSLTSVDGAVRRTAGLVYRASPRVLAS